MNPTNMKQKKKYRNTVFAPKKVRMAPKVHEETEKLTKGHFSGKRWVPYNK